MKLSEKGYTFLGKEEGIRLRAYLDPVGVPTIGYGNTFYQDGTKVKMGDTVTPCKANALFHSIVKEFEDGVNKYVTSDINQNQFDALVSIAYNIGLGAFKKSTLLKRVNINPSTPLIREAFIMWKFSGGKPILLNRRIREADLYFS